MRFLISRIRRCLIVFFHLIRLHRETEREYFMIADNTAPIDRDQMCRDNLEALGDRMENIIEAICALC